MMLERTTIIDANFIQQVKNNQLPESVSSLSLTDVSLSAELLIGLFQSQIASRHIDFQARKLKEKNQGFYTIGSFGHEANAAIALVFRHTDMAFLHYRSAAFMIERAKKLPGINAIYDQLLSLTAASADPISGGRHKVFGSVPLFIPPQTSTIASHLPKAVGMAFSIVKAKSLHLNMRVPEDSVVLCSFGDASVNHAAALTAFNAASWIKLQQTKLPLVFICEDNGFGISVRTPANWIEDNFKVKPYIHYIKADGLNILDVYQKAKLAEKIAREQQTPVFLHIKLVRLLGHAGSDIEQQYRTLAEIEKDESQDPLLHTARIVLENHCLTQDEVINLYLSIQQDVGNQAEQIVRLPKLLSKEEVMSSIIPPWHEKIKIHSPTTLQRHQAFGSHYSQLSQPRNLAQLINFALMDLLLTYPNMVLFGEDVGKKGGVYHVTADLAQRFGQQRVFDTLLDETMILATAIGFGQNGFIPIVEIQYLAYLHNAEDQLRGEAATLSFFSKGQYTNPMVIRIPGLAYQKGFGGHFHNDNALAVLRDIPGLIVACPSNGEDAVKMLRECVRLATQENRIVVFIEPIALYMTKDLHESGDNAWLRVYPAPNKTIAFGEIGMIGESQHLTILSFGNGYYLSCQAKKIIETRMKLPIKLIDIRWLCPLNEKVIIQAIQGSKNILIVDEERKSGSISEALITLIVENCPNLPRIKRITACDTFIPLGDAAKLVLPSKEQIVEAAITLLTGEA